MAATVQDLLSQHSTNHVQTTGYHTTTDKQWTRQYPSIESVAIYSFSLPEDPDTVLADFESAMLPDYDDDHVRWAQLAFPPNKRSWRLETEEDCGDWFKAEVSNIVLAAWTDYPAILQVSHAKPFSASSSSETVDVSYTFTHLSRKVPVVIGEWKRNLIRPQEWIDSSLSSGQQKLAKELRGYADKYQCPQIFCFDGEWLLMLQFRAKFPEKIKDPKCKVDCWLIPRVNGDSGMTFRYALYRFLAQGFRRVHSYYWPTTVPTRVGGLLPEPNREFFSGRPIWKVDGVSHAQHPGGFQRAIDIEYGAFYWTHDDQSLLPVTVLWDTQAFRRSGQGVAVGAGDGQVYVHWESENL